MVVVAGATGFELISHGVLPGQQTLDRLDGGCSVAGTPLSFSSPGLSTSGTFYSEARQPDRGLHHRLSPGSRDVSDLPLVVMLHGFGGNHTNALAGMSPAQAVALRVDGLPLAPDGHGDRRRRGRVLEPPPR